jgi:hypothetical protein
MQLLSTTKASLRCLEVASGGGLALGGAGAKAAHSSAGDADVQQFIEALLCTAHPSSATAAASSISGSDSTAGAANTLQLLWQLAVQQPGISSVAARRAHDILLWSLAPPLAHLQAMLLGPAVEACCVAELASHVGLLASGTCNAQPSPFCLVSVTCGALRCPVRCGAVGAVGAVWLTALQVGLSMSLI